jgi:uncharacterized protein YehS (DUF1456 family)
VDQAQMTGLLTAATSLDKSKLSVLVQHENNDTLDFISSSYEMTCMTRENDDANYNTCMNRTVLRTLSKPYC